MKRILAVLLLASWPCSPMMMPPGFVPASEWTQLLNHAQLVLQLAKQAQMLKVQIEQYAHMTLQGKLFSAIEFAPIAQQLLALKHNIVQGQGIAYTMSNLDLVFRQTYPGYLANGASFDQQYQRWNQVNLDTISAALKTLSLHGSALDSDAKVLSVIEHFASSATGQNEVLQAGTMLADAQVQSLAQLRQLMMTQLQSELNFQGRQINNEQVKQQVQQQAFGPVQYRATN